MQDGKGSAAQLMQRPALIWILGTGGHGELLNYSPITKTKSAIQLLHTENHYEALLINDKLNVQQLSRLALTLSSGYVDLDPQSNPPANNPVAIDLATVVNDLAVPLKEGVSKRRASTTDLCNLVETARNLNFPQSCKRPRSTGSRKKLAFNLPIAKCKTSLKRSRPISGENVQEGSPAPISTLMPTNDFLQHNQMYPVRKSARLANQSSRLSKLKDPVLSSSLATDTLKPLPMTPLQTIDGSDLSTFPHLHSLYCHIGQSDSQRTSLLSRQDVPPTSRKRHAAVLVEQLHIVQGQQQITQGLSRSDPGLSLSRQGDHHTHTDLNKIGWPSQQSGNKGMYQSCTPG
jgi:hypothetical protein